MSTMALVYTDFTIRHFRLFEDVSVRLAPVTIVSGKNNAGKTALLEALFLHASGPQAGYRSLTTLNASRSGTPITMSQQEGQTIWDSLFTGYDTSRPVEFRAVLDDNIVGLELVPTASMISAGSISVTGVGTASEGYSQSLDIKITTSGEVSEYTQTATQQMYTQPGSGLSPGIGFQFGGISLRLNPNVGPLLNASFLSGRVRSTSQELAQRYSAIRQLNRQQDFVSALKSIDPRIADVEVLVKDGQSSLNLSMSGQLMPLSLFGEGLVTFADIMSIIYSRNTKVLLIDEIENGIHYSVMRDVWRHIKRAARATGAQVIASTHSHECLAAAQAAFDEDSSDMVRLLRLSRSQKRAGGIVVTSYNSSEFESAIDLNLDLR